MSDEVENESDVEEPVGALRMALVRYATTGSPRALDAAFADASSAVAALRGERASQPADAVEVRELLTRLPEFEQLVMYAVAEAERGAQAGAASIWRHLGLTTRPPGWDPRERSAARLLVALACVPLDQRGAEWLRPRLLRLVAVRWAAVLIADLRGAEEDVWRRALGDRYESVRRHYAQRSRWRTHELARLVAGEQRTAETIERRLAQWIEAGARLDVLDAELETAFVLARTPARLA